MALDEAPILEQTNEFFTCLFDDVGALTIFLPGIPVSRVDVFVFVCHHSFSMTLVILPVAVILANVLVSSFADAVLLVVLPLTLVCDLASIFGTLGCVSVLSISVANLNESETFKTVSNVLKYLHHP